MQQEAKVAKKNGKVSQQTESKLSSDCWYEGMNHQQLHLALAVPPLAFPHGPQQKKQKKSH
jgi:hypothetical protein